MGAPIELLYLSFELSQLIGDPLLLRTVISSGQSQSSAVFFEIASNCSRNF